jgi:hypothetical protein
MPGLLQYKADLEATNGPIQDPEHPEEIELWLPSRIPLQACQRVCGDRLSSIEEKLRTAQCHDALDSLRHILKIKTRLIKFKNKNVRGQREGTKSRTVIDRVHNRARVAAEKYRSARAAKLLLAGPGDWESELKVLLDEDIRGYQDPSLLRRRVGRQGIWEDGHSPDPVERPAEETDNFTLFVQERKKKDGTGETRRVLSWIWTSGATADDPDDAEDDILRSEWAKSRARAARAFEEVCLLHEEMRRVLEFLEWKGNWWISQCNLRSVDGDLSEGLCSYAHAQAELQFSLAKHFRSIWHQPLHETENDPSTEGTSTPHDIQLSESPVQLTGENAVEGGEDDDDEDDDDEGDEGFMIYDNEDD